jgi:tetratricopeptide (TPR) repeat protein
MARKITVTAIITLMFVSLSCQEPYTGTSDRLPDRNSGGTVYPGGLISENAGEASIIEMVVKTRMEYKESLEVLRSFYSKSGNDEKYRNASAELDALNKMPQYDYYNLLLLEGYNPSTLIPDADILYESAMLDKKAAEKIPAFPKKNLYRSALSKIKDLLRTYKTSDKIDDAAFAAGEISEKLKDYSKALEYYTATYTWNSETLNPARLKAARILDRYQHNYAEALPLYKKGIEIEGRYNKHYELVKNAKERVAALEKTVEP